MKRLQPVGTGPLQGGPTKTRCEPVLLLDPEMDRVGKLAAQLEQMGFPIRIEGSGVGALAAIKDTYLREPSPEGQIPCGNFPTAMVATREKSEESNTCT